MKNTRFSVRAAAACVLLCCVGFLAFAPAAGAEKRETVPVTFTVKPAGASGTIYLAGTFNGWSSSQDAMKDEDGDGVFEITLNLKPASYEYKFVQDGKWFEDPHAASSVSDPYGGKNSVVVVPDGADKLLVGVKAKGQEAAKETAGAAGQEKAQAPGQAKASEKGPAGTVPVTFLFDAGKGSAPALFLAGTFNGWDAAKDRMTDPDGDGIYEITMNLAPGSHQYKFVKDGSWITDTNAKEFADDGYGGKNSVIVVDDSFPDSKIEKGDGLMMNRDIPLTLDYSMVNPLSPTTIEFRARAHLNDVESVDLILPVGPPAGSHIPYKHIEMKPAESDGVFQYYSYVIPVPSTAEARFAFRYTDGGKEFYATPAGFSDKAPAADAMFVYSDKVLEPFFTPDWAKNGVFYQIFPERFRNGDTENDPKFTEPYYAGVTTLPASGKTNGEYFHLVTQWDNVSGLTQSPYRTDGKPDYYSFYGGDIKGVMDAIPYLHDLGITIIYFNPLNEARSNHKYDPVDYLKIDPHFADEATFIAFVKKAHENGIRIIVDMALNHTGDWHFAFVDTKEKGPDSKYWNWYEWKRWPLPSGKVERACDYYDCWWCFGNHPNLNYDLSRPNDQENGVVDIAQAKPEMDVVNYVLEVPRYWIGKLGIDGFRLDVPNEVPFWFWRLFRKAVDEAKPDALLVGELWGNAMPWLGPHCFHSTMNYKFFKDPVVKFIGLGQGDAAAFDRELAPGRSIYPIQATEAMMNLIDSHDTERFITTAGNSADRIMLAALFQMTYVGTPQVYYGDEVGLRGAKDPDDRRTFPWDWETNPGRKAIHDFYRSAIAIRHKYAALRTGDFRTVLTDGRVYSYLREDDANRIVVVLNGDAVAREVELNLKDFDFADGAAFKDEIGGATHRIAGGVLKIALEPLKGAILVPAAK
jgi:cyclomaltodextrinase